VAEDAAGKVAKEECNAGEDTFHAFSIAPFLIVPAAFAAVFGKGNGKKQDDEKADENKEHLTHDGVRVEKEKYLPCLILRQAPARLGNICILPAARRRLGNLDLVGCTVARVVIR
jgi:hypothetical protein